MGGDDPKGNPSPYCMCGLGPFKTGEWCPRCWPDKQPKVKQLNLFDGSE